MGTWGPDIFDDDFALDIKEEYQDLLESGLSHEATTKALVDSNKDAISDPEDSAVLWLALAAIQLDHNELLTVVKNNALAVINSNQDLLRWADSPDASSRKRVLEELKRQLLEY
jgi:hypothetical protein